MVLKVGSGITCYYLMLAFEHDIIHTVIYWHTPLYTGKHWYTLIYNVIYVIKGFLL